MDPRASILVKASGSQLSLPLTGCPTRKLIENWQSDPVVSTVASEQERCRFDCSEDCRSSMCQCAFSPGSVALDGCLSPCVCVCSW